MMSNLFPIEAPESMRPPATPLNWRAAIEQAVASGLSVEVKFSDEEAEQARQASEDGLTSSFVKYAEETLLERDRTRLLAAMKHEGGTDVRAALDAALANSGQKPHYVLVLTDGPAPVMDGPHQMS
jgi:hypothetical protein